MVTNQADRIRALAQKTTREFAEEAKAYDGSREAFLVLITFAINNHNVEPSRIARACGVLEKTVFNWTHGGAPEQEKTRRAIIKKLVPLLR